MSQLIPKNQIQKADVLGVIIDRECVFNIEVLMGANKHTCLKSTKRWCLQNGVNPLTMRGNWWFYGGDVIDQLREFAKGQAQRNSKGNKNEDTKASTRSNGCATSGKRRRGRATA
jgi:hypothetical protein